MEKQKLVRETIRRIKSDPEHFEMLAISRADECGTCYCIAGHMARILKGEKAKDYTLPNSVPALYRIFGQDTADELFYMSTIGGPTAREKFDTLAPAKRAKIAVRLLETYLETDKADWIAAGFNVKGRKKS